MQDYTIFDLLSDRCEHCGKPVLQCSLVTAFADTGAICEACAAAHDQNYWREWVAVYYPDHPLPTEATMSVPQNNWETEELIDRLINTEAWYTQAQAITEDYKLEDAQPDEAQYSLQPLAAALSAWATREGGIVEQIEIFVNNPFPGEIDWVAVARAILPEPETPDSNDRTERYMGMTDDELKAVTGEFVTETTSGRGDFHYTDLLTAAERARSICRNLKRVVWVYQIDDDGNEYLALEYEPG